MAPVWQAFVDRHRAVLTQNHGWEYRFVIEVLAHVSALSPDVVHPQYRFSDADGRARYIDFAIIEHSPVAGGHAVRIAIEVDGYDKTGAGGGPTPKQMADALWRQNALATQGWKVLRFMNAEFARHPHRAVRDIESVLAREREAALTRQGHADPAAPTRVEAQYRLVSVVGRWIWAAPLVATVLSVLATQHGWGRGFYAAVQWWFFLAATLGVGLVAVRRSWQWLLPLILLAVINSPIWRPRLPKAGWLIADALGCLVLWFSTAAAREPVVREIRDPD